MGLIVENFLDNVSGEVRSKSFIIRDTIGGQAEFDWEEWDGLQDILKTIETHKPPKDSDGKDGT